MIAIIDLELGNLYSVSSALKHLNAEFIITNNVEEITKADKIILSGVGSYKTGMQHMHSKGIVDPIVEFFYKKKPILGICLGMQLLMEYSEENGGVKGLGLISGDVKYINNKRNFINGQKVPHIGWRSLGKSNIDWNDSILKGVQEADEFYFVHSLCVETSAVNELSVTNYSGVEFCSAIKYNNIFGCQFHPEKSGSVGLKVIENFTNI